MYMYFIGSSNIISRPGRPGSLGRSKGGPCGRAGGQGNQVAEAGDSGRRPQAVRGRQPTLASAKDTGDELLGAPPAPASAFAPPPLAGEEQKFDSDVGPLPKFGAGRAADTDAVSEVGSTTPSQAEAIAEEAATSKEQRQQAKTVVKEFVKSMVKGKRMQVVASSGSVKTCNISLSRDLSELKVKVGVQIRSIPLQEPKSSKRALASPICQGLAERGAKPRAASDSSPSQTRGGNRKGAPVFVI